MLAIESPYPQFFDLDGSPLDSGYIWIGIENQNPETNPLTVYWDVTLTEPAPQPLRTMNGYIVRAGTPAFVYAETNHSMMVRNSRMVQVVYAQSSKQFNIAASLNVELDQLRADLANPNDPAKGAGMVGFLQAGEGAIGRTSQNKMRERVSVRDFGAVGDGMTDDTAAFLACRNHLQASSNFRGGVIVVPSGYYKLSQEWAFTPYVTGQVFNIEICGEGMESTVLDFSSAPSTANGISAVGHGASFFVSGMSIKFAPKHGVLLQGGARGSTAFMMRCGLRNVRLQSCGGSGLFCQNTFMMDLDHCWSFGHTGAGFNFDGFHTSLNLRTSWAQNNGTDGWAINGAIYFHFSACGSDENGSHGYALSNVQGGVFSGCGAEQNTRDGWYLFTSTGSTTGLDSSTQDVRGIVFSGCYGWRNSAAGPGLYATFLAALTADVRPIDFKIIGGAAHGTAPSDVALVLNGSSGRVSCSKENFHDATFTTPDVLLNSVEVKNMTVATRRITSGLSDFTQSIPQTTLTELAIQSVPGVNDLGATVSGGAVVIPRGVNRVVISASVAFLANAVGVRQLFLRKNGAAFAGLPAAAVNAASTGATVLSVKSPPISVVQGETISAAVFQSSGAALGVAQDTYTFLSVEAVC